MLFSPPVSQSSTSQSYSQSFKQSQRSSQTSEQPESSPASSQTIESSPSSSQRPNSPSKSQLLAQAKGDEFQKCKENNNYRYIQQKLCNTDFFNPVTGKYFKREIPTPFGTVTVDFRPCKKDKRFTRYVRKGGTYKEVINFLNRNIKDTEKIGEIFKVILEYMTYSVDNTNSLSEDLQKCLDDIHKNHKDLFAYLNIRKTELTPYEKTVRKCQRVKHNTYKKPYKNEEETNEVMNTLACLCAFLTFCDPCYGTKIAGGAETRGFLRTLVEKKQHDFIILLNEKLYFFSKKFAYIRARNYIEWKIIDKDIDALYEYMSDLHSSIMDPDSTQPIEEVVPSSQASSRNPSASSSIFKQPENDGLGLSVIEF